MILSTSGKIIKEREGWSKQQIIMLIFFKRKMDFPFLRLSNVLRSGVWNVLLPLRKQCPVPWTYCLQQIDVQIWKFRVQGDLSVIFFLVYRPNHGRFQYKYLPIADFSFLSAFLHPFVWPFLLLFPFLSPKCMTEVNIHRTFEKKVASGCWGRKCSFTLKRRKS